MRLDADACYAALCARDRRFDGLFFVGVATTGIYCRPVCAARTPGKTRCSYYASPAEAERAGFRACFRCRPELAPGACAVDALPQLVARAVARIDEGFLDAHGVDELARALGVTGRHLRRALEEQVGASPLELAQSRRLALAKRLLQDSRLGVTEVAFASGFNSVRRFNAAFRERFGRAPTELRREHAPAAETLALRLDYRPPLEWATLLEFLRVRAIAGVEAVAGDEYRRVVHLAGKTGVVRVRPDGERPALRAELALELAGAVTPLIAGLKKLFDLDAEPTAVAERLGRDPLLRAGLRRRPGLRVPGCVDAFEVAARAVVGQQVSVKAAVTLMGRLAQRLGAAVSGGEALGLTRRFPTAAEVAAASVDELASVGMPRARATTLRDVAQVFASGRFDRLRAGDEVDFIGEVGAIRGIGPWTLDYLKMRVLHLPDAFLAGDLGVRNALGGVTAAAALARAEAWRPWRAYAVVHLWTALGAGEKR
jgi:AraC family transcriptional regulator, regulatory protein of adaptative response / DNA-3-methyladenine glycosylase II